ncbi:ATP-binding cassette domain-containing protein [Kineosporia babensis]|uniref:hypothetical protein n=1 Tax=Kineosporia babensis TaxID=499548 RepID=UPI0038B30060
MAAFASQAELLLLDEPTSGLDPLMENVFRECVAESQSTVLLSSHILSEVEQLCQRVSIVRAGRTVDSGSLDEMRQLTSTTIEAELDREPADLNDLSGVHQATVESGDPVRVRCEVAPEAFAEVMRRLSAAGTRSLISRKPTLEELFLQHYRHEEVS